MTADEPGDQTTVVEITQISLMRVRRPHEHHRVTYVELFFDLVFVFAVTQVSHALLADLSACFSPCRATRPGYAETSRAS